jgi:hypothetical protein
MSLSVSHESDRTDQQNSYLPPHASGRVVAPTKAAPNAKVCRGPLNLSASGPRVAIRCVQPSKLRKTTHVAPCNVSVCCIAALGKFRGFVDERRIAARLGEPRQRRHGAVQVSGMRFSILATTELHSIREHPISVMPSFSSTVRAGALPLNHHLAARRRSWIEVLLGALSSSGVSAGGARHAIRACVYDCVRQGVPELAVSFQPS